MKTIVELEGAISAKRNRVTELFKDGTAGMKEEQVKEAQTLNVELNDLGGQLSTARDLDNIAQTNRKALAEAEDAERKSGRLPTPAAKQEKQPQQAKTVGDYLRERTADFARIKTERGQITIDMPDVDVKTLVTLTTINNQATRQGIVPLALEARMVADLMLGGTLDNNGMEYYEETTFTNAAGMVAEGGTKPESAIAFTLRSETTRKVAHNIPMTDEALEDVAGLEAQIRGRLVFGVERKKEQQVLTGTGVAPQLLGILNRGGVLPQARGADPVFDTIYKAMTKIRNVGFAEPTAVVMNPTDWQNLVLTRTADGLYILGNPAGEAPTRIWGLEVRATTEMTVGTGLVGAFRPYAQLFTRGGIVVTLSTEHSTFFAENKVLIQAEQRVLLAVYRPAAFCVMTGL